MKQIAILIIGEYDCYDAYTRHENETHSVDEWRKIYENENCYTKVYRFDTGEELAAFLNGVEAVDDFISGDHYTAYVQSNRITDNE